MSTDTPPPPVQAKTPLPGWAKALVALFTVTLTVIVVGIIGIASVFAVWQKDARDPAKIAPIAASEFKIAQLPSADFHYLIGYKFEPLSLIQISYKNDQTLFALMRMHNVHKLTDANLPEVAEDDPMQPGISVDNGKPGEETVAGHKMAYTLGDLAPGGKIKQMRGAFLTDNNAYVVRFAATTYSPNFNMDATKQLLQCIK